MTNRRKTLVMSIVVIIFCIAMAFVDGVFHANYFTKSLIKLVLFMGCPALYITIDKNVRIKPLFVFDRKGLKLALSLCTAVYFVILGGYFALRGVFDFSSITALLTSNIGVTKDNFIYVSLYISFANSLLEEFFFRGFAFLTLKKLAGRGYAYVFSSVSFALYHVAMMIGWFSPIPFVIVMVGLFAGGMIFNYLNEKSGTVYPSWLVHMFANFAINTVGFILFGVI